MQLKLRAIKSAFYNVQRYQRASISRFHNNDLIRDFLEIGLDGSDWETSAHSFIMFVAKRRFEQKCRSDQ